MPLPCRETSAASTSGSSMNATQPTQTSAKPRRSSAVVRCIRVRFAFTIPVKGRESPRLELLRVDGMFRKGNAPWVQWAYFRWKGRHMGLHKFVPLMDGNAQRRQPHFYQDSGSPTNGKRCEILMVWSPPSPVEGDFMLPAEKLCDLQYWYDLPLCLHLHPY